MTHAAVEMTPPLAASRVRDDFVVRTRQLRRLAEASEVPLVVIAAPPGYGKTSLLAQWAERDDRTFRSIALTDDDNDPGQLAATLIATLELRLSGKRVRAGLAHLCRQLRTRTRPFVLALDDVDRIHSARSLEVLARIAGEVPRGSQLALASRAEPALPLGRLRAQRAVLELHARDLVMSRSEAAALVRLCGVEATADEIDVLLERTEGWPAGLYLAAMSLLEQRCAPGAVERFGGDDYLVAGYLRDELVSGLPEETFAFLTRSSILRRLSGQACDEVLGRSGSALVLRDLARRNLLTRADRAEEWYRYHPLVRDMLQAELHQLDPERERELHRRASDWCGRHGDREGAVDHAAAANDLSRAAALLWESVPAYVTQGRNASIQRWIGRFGPEQVASSLQLGLSAAVSELVAGRLGAARRVVSETAAPGTSEEAALAVLRALVAGDGVASMRDEAARAAAMQRDDGPGRAVCRLLSGVGHHLTGARERARDELADGARCGVVAAPLVQALCLAQLAAVAIDEDDWERPAVFTKRASAQVAHYGLADLPTSALVHAVSAVVRAHRGAIDDAKADMARATDLLASLDDFLPWYVAETRLALARAALRLGDVRGARRDVDEAFAFADQDPHATVLAEWLSDLRSRIDTFYASDVVARSALTAAELRVLQLLPTHLCFREIAGRLYVSANTVKTQAHAVYRKLDVSSRSEAVVSARRLGLLDA